jgi:hypothetical protein
LANRWLLDAPPGPAADIVARRALDVAVKRYSEFSASTSISWWADDVRRAAMRHS